MRSDRLSSYSLGYTSPHGGDGEEHTIEVEVSRPGAVVRHTSGYRDRPPEDALELLAATALLLGGGANPLDLELHLGRPRGGPEGSLVTTAAITVPLEKLAFLPREDAHEASLEMLLLIQDKDGVPASGRRYRFPVRVPTEQLEAALGQRGAYQTELELAAGARQIAVAARDPVGGVAGVLVVALEGVAPAAPESADASASGTRTEPPAAVPGRTAAAEAPAVAPAAPRPAPARPTTRRSRRAAKDRSPGKAERQLAALRKDFLPRYRALLTDYAGGAPFVDVVTRLAALEAEVEQRGSIAAVEAVATLVERESERLAASDVEALLPLAVLHLELYRDFADRGQAYLAERARRTCAALASRYAAAAEHHGADRAAATILLDLAIRTRVRTARHRLIEEALDIDGDHPSVLLAAAATWEEEGEYRRAVELLERLLDHFPQSTEGRLRLAMNLDRVGRGVAAEELWNELLGEGLPAFPSDRGGGSAAGAEGASNRWILALAYQELARRQLRNGRWNAAAAILIQGLELLPEEPRLSLLLAFVRDRQSRTSDACEILERVRPREDLDGSPRLRYSRWTRDPLDATRRALREQSRLRSPALKKALDATREEASP